MLVTQLVQINGLSHRTSSCLFPHSAAGIGMEKGYVTHFDLKHTSGKSRRVSRAER